MSDSHKYADIVEALILATDRPISASRLASVAVKLKTDEIPAIIDHLNSSYEETGRAFRIREIAGGYRLFTLPDYESYVDALAVTTREARVSQAGLETLAVVAYRQPVAKADIEYVRGCDCDGVLRTLLGRRLLAIKGRSDAPGRPLLYTTTERFLEYFGISQITDLPDWNEIASMVGELPSQISLTLTRGAEPSLTDDGSVEADSGAQAEKQPIQNVQSAVAAAQDGAEPEETGDEHDEVSESSDADIDMAEVALSQGDET